MGREIDERVVEMRFDNQRFEENANKSIATLKKLDDSLNFENTGQSLDKIQNAANRLSFTPIASAIDGVHEKFNALEIMATGAFMRIGNQIEATAEKMIRSFTTDNIAAGWEKFGNKTNSVATLVSQGYDLSQVNEQMNRLNWFTDETSYNFTDMVSNIAKFTATGQDLETSVTAMEGIATWAALSGQSAQKASMAMYQLSQAMSKGALKYDDFKSIQNASMDTQEFRAKALEAAVALGKVKKNLNGTYQVGKKTFSLNEMFSSEALSRTQWFSSEVMMETFNKYSAAVNQLYEAVDSGEYETASEAIQGMGKSVDAFGLKAFKAAQQARTWKDVVDSVKDAVSTGWMQTFEFIFGNYEEATELWTDLANGLYDIFAEPGNRRNKILETWYGLGGRGELIQSFKNIWGAVERFTGLIKGAWEVVFPPKTAEAVGKGLKKITDGFLDITTKAKLFFAPFEEAVLPALEAAKEATEEFGEKIEEAKEQAEEIIKPISEIEETAKRVIQGVYGNGQERRNLLEEEGHSYEIIQNKVNELMGSAYRYTETAEMWAKYTGEVAENTEKASKVSREDMMGLSPDDVERMEKANDRSNKLFKTFQGIFSLVRLFRKALTAVGKIVKKLADKFNELILMPIVDLALDAGAAFGDWAVQIEAAAESSGFFNDVVEKASGFIDTLAETITKFWNGALKGFKKFFEDLSKSSAVEKLAGAFERLKGVLSDWGSRIFGTISDSYSDMLKNIETEGIDFSWLDAIAETVADKLGDFINFVVDNAPSIENFFSLFTDAAAHGLSAVGGAFTVLSDGIQTLGDKAKPAMDWFSQQFDKIFPGFESVTKNVENASTNLQNTVTGAFEEVDTKGFFGILKNLAVAGFFGVLTSKILKLKDSLLNLPTMIVDTLELFQQKLAVERYEKVANIALKIAKAIGILAASLFVLSLVDQNALSNASAALVAASIGLALVIAAYTKLKGLQFKAKDNMFYDAFSTFFAGIKKAFSDAAKMAGLGAMIAGIAIGIGILVVALLKIKDAVKAGDDVSTAMGYIIGLLASLTTFAILYSRFGKRLKVGDAVSFIAIALSLKIMVGILVSVMELLNSENVDPKKLGLVVILVSLLTVAVGAAAGLAGSGEGKALLKSVVFIIAMSFVIKQMFGVIDMIANYNEGQLKNAAAGFLAVIGLVVVLAIASEVLSNVSNGDLGVRTLVGMAIALGIISAVCVGVGNYAEQAGKGLWIIIIALAAFVAVAVVFNFIQTGLLGLSAALESFGLAAIGIGIAAVGIAAAFWIISNAIPQFIESAILLEEALKTHGDTIKMLLIAIVAIIIGVIIASQPQLMAGIASLIQTILGGLKSALPGFLQTTWGMLLVVLAFLIAIVPQLAQGLIDIALKLMNTFAELFVKNAPRLLNAIQRMIIAWWDVFVEVWATLLGSFIPWLGDWLRNTLQKDLPPVLEESGQEDAEHYVGSFAKTAEEEINKMDTKDVVKTAVDDIFDDDATHRSGYNAAYSGMEGYGQGLTDGQGITLDALTNMEGGIEEYLANSGLGEHFSGFGTDLMNMEGMGITDGSNQYFIPAVNESASAGSDAASEYQDEYYTVGKEYLGKKGLAAGLAAAEPEVKASGKTLGKAGLDGVKESTLTFSPSRAMIWIGNMMGLGLTNGMEDKIGDIKKTGSLIGSNALNAVENATKGIYDVLNQDLDLNPVIRPVLDDSGIQNGIGNVNSMFDRLAFATGTTYTGNLSGIRSANNPNNLGEAIDKAVRKAIGDISDNVTDRLSTKTTIEVPLNIDGRRVAKATAEYTRNELARLDKYNSRKGGKV